MVHIRCFGGIVLALLAGRVVFAGQAQEATNSADEVAITRNIDQTIQRAIDRSRFTVPGGATGMTTPVLSSQEYAVVQSYGDQATPILAQYLSSTSFFKQLLAMRLLANLGSNSAKDTLDAFAEKARMASTRYYAVDFVASSGRKKDIAVLEKLAKADPDPNVRRRALDVLRGRRQDERP